MAGVTCPICRETIALPPAPTRVFEWIQREGRFSEVDLSGMDPAKARKRRSESYLLCPRPQSDPLDRHYLPADYHLHGPPVIIGLVGRIQAGKTHLLVAMLAELFRGAGREYGLTQVTPLDVRQHLEFEAQITRFLAGSVLDGTLHDVRRYAQSVRVTTPSGPRTVVFFDVAGEDFHPGTAHRSAEFLLAVDAVIIVEDIGEVRSPGNKAITGAVAALEARADAAAIPVALVLAKADEERYTEPIDHWLREPPHRAPLAAGFREESADVYAWLHANDATLLLSVAEAFPRCTLHVASASGGAPVGETFPRGVRPTRVLEPLVAVLESMGVLTAAAARRPAGPR